MLYFIPFILVVLINRIIKWRLFVNPLWHSILRNFFCCVFFCKSIKTTVCVLYMLLVFLLFFLGKNYWHMKVWKNVRWHFIKIEKGKAICAQLFKIYNIYLFYFFFWLISAIHIATTSCDLTNWKENEIFFFYTLIDTCHNRTLNGLYLSTYNAFI